MFVVWWNTDDGCNREGERSFDNEEDARNFFDEKCSEDGIGVVELYDYAKSRVRAIAEWVP